MGVHYTDQTSLTGIGTVDDKSLSGNNFIVLCCVMYNVKLLSV